MITLDFECFSLTCNLAKQKPKEKSFKYVVTLKQIASIYRLSYTLKLIADDKKKIDFHHIPP